MILPSLVEDEKSKPKRKPKGKKDKPKKEKKGEVKEEETEDAELKAKKKEVEKKAKKACAGGLGLHDRAKKQLRHQTVCHTVAEVVAFAATSHST